MLSFINNTPFQFNTDSREESFPLKYCNIQNYYFMFSTHVASFEKFAFWFGYPLRCLCLKSYNFTILMHETYDHLKMLQDQQDTIIKRQISIQSLSILTILQFDG